MKDMPLPDASSIKSLRVSYGCDEGATEQIRIYQSGTPLPQDPLEEPFETSRIRKNLQARQKELSSELTEEMKTAVTFIEQAVVNAPAANLAVLQFKSTTRQQHEELSRVFGGEAKSYRKVILDKAVHKAVHQKIGEPLTGTMTEAGLPVFAAAVAESLLNGYQLLSNNYDGLLPATGISALVALVNAGIGLTTALHIMPMVRKLQVQNKSTLGAKLLLSGNISFATILNASFGAFRETAGFTQALGEFSLPYIGMMTFVGYAVCLLSYRKFSTVETDTEYARLGEEFKRKQQACEDLLRHGETSLYETIDIATTELHQIGEEAETLKSDAIAALNDIKALLVTYDSHQFTLQSLHEGLADIYRSSVLNAGLAVDTDSFFRRPADYSALAPEPVDIASLEARVQQLANDVDKLCQVTIPECEEKLLAHLDECLANLNKLRDTMPHEHNANEVKLTHN